MAYAICRIEKLHASNLKSSAQHVERKRTTLNADPEKPHICIIGEADSDLGTLVRERISKENISKVRKNAVMAVEFILTASPEYFRPDDPSQYGYWESEKLEAFQATASKWLLEKYGDCIVKAELHLDEATPHIHAYLVPITNGKLNCRELFGTRSKLSKLQDSYAKALKPLGIERGLKGSKATHTDIKKYYTTVNHMSLSLSSFSMEEIERLSVENPKLLKENRELKITLFELKQQWEVVEYKKLELELKIDALAQQVELWKEKYKSLSNQTLDKPLKTSLSEVARLLGLKPVAKAGEKQLWQSGEHNYVINGNSFQKLQPSSSKSMDSPNKSGQEKSGQNNNGQDSNREIPGGEEVNPIDLVMEVTRSSYEQVITWFYRYFGDEATHEIIKQHAKLTAEKTPEFNLNRNSNVPHLSLLSENKSETENRQSKTHEQTIKDQQTKAQKQQSKHENEESIHHSQQNLNKPITPKRGGIKRQ